MKMSPKERAGLVVAIHNAPKGHEESEGEEPEGEGEGEEEKGDPAEEAHMAAGALRQALRGSDDQAIVEAFMHLQSCCEEMEGSSPEEAPEE